MTRWQILGWVLAAVIGGVIGAWLEYRPSPSHPAAAPRTFHPEVGWTTCTDGW